ncbi:MAG: putative zinc-binding protein [Syntrophobacteraceae bacterium]|nr:putative zinc-binding protein [Syntrophobacteraceae bacterium]
MLTMASKPGDRIVIFACSGGSNVGQLSNRAAVELTGEGFGKMSCLAGVGGELMGFVHAAMTTPVVVVIDGCAIGCGKACFEKADVPIKVYLVLTELGIEKTGDMELQAAETAKVKEAVRQAVARYEEETAKIAP